MKPNGKRGSAHGNGHSNSNGNGNGKGNSNGTRSVNGNAPVALRSIVTAPAVLITGGAGFIGCNLAHRLLSEGRAVILFDNLSRNGVRRNLDWLQQTHGQSADIRIADIRDMNALKSAMRGCSEVFHFAAQVAVTTSLEDPIGDFEVNAGGTLNVLEAIRAASTPPPLVFTSTNKVYGALDDVATRATRSRYEPVDATIRMRGIGEDRPLDFHSPYGCSKGAADQYVRDYARSFGIETVVLRMSCIYGPHQHGNEDQGWLAHFLLSAMRDEPVILYGDGKQVRDVLFVEDLVDAMLLAQKNMSRLTGSAFNIGGGPQNTTSLLEVLDMIADVRGGRVAVEFQDWRTGDQRYYVSDTTAFQNATGWAPRVGLEDGLQRLYNWIDRSREAVPVARTASVTRLAALERSRDGVLAVEERVS